MNNTEICIRRPVFAWMLMAATIVFGVVAISRIGISQYPDVDFPTITVSVTWEGAAPDVIEQPRHMLDLSLRTTVLGSVSLKLDAKNLLDAPYELVQGDVTRESYRSGRSYSVGLSWKQ